MMKQYQLIEAGTGFWIIEEHMVRSFLIIGSKRALLIDSGCMITDIKGIVRKLTDLPVILANTHADPDHINCNQQFDHVYMHPAEYAKYHNFVKRNDSIRPLWDGEIISLGNREFQVVLNPGHTSGCITFLDKKNRILIGGDSIQNGDIFLFGEERDLLAYLHSLNRIQALSEQIDFIYPSHAGCPVSINIVKKLSDGVEKVLTGKIKGVPAFYEDTPIRIFNIGTARILYEREKEFFEIDEE